ncbi:MAG: amidohydrolase family protein, partial [Pseudomonadota bacterium]
VHQPTLDAGKLMESVDLMPRDFLYWATMGGAKAINLDDRIGSLTPGKQADIVLMRARGPMNDPATTIVTAMDTSNVDTVIVAGKTQKRAGAMLNGASERAEKLVNASRDYVVPKADLKETVGAAWV